MGIEHDHNSWGAVAPGGDEELFEPVGLDEVLSGELPCWVCAYNLSGLSVTGVCPECGTPVRTTLLAVVDPAAATFHPLWMPRVAAVGLVLWTLSSILAALTIWIIRAGDLLSVWLGLPGRIDVLGVIAPVLAGVCGLGSLVLIHPHRGANWRQTLCPAVATMLYVPLVWLLWLLHGRLDIVSGVPYFSDSIRQMERVEMRVCIGALIVAIALLSRPSLREFAKRSVLMRTGQLTRQTMVAIAAAQGVALSGDLLKFGLLTFETPGNVIFRTMAMLLVAVGSILVTVGFVGIFWDAIRLYPIIRSGPRALGDVVGREARRA